MLEYKMPSLGADMDKGTLIQWHVKPGDAVKRGDIIADVETEKGIIEAEVWTPGIIIELTVQPGQKVPVGTVLALLKTDEVEAKAPIPAMAPPAPAQARLRVSPLARKAAAELGIDLSLVKGTGEGGAISKADIEAWQAQRQLKPEVASPVEPAQDRFAAMRHAIAQAMSRSKREIPHYYLQTEINMQKSLEWLERINSDRPLTERILPIALFIKAVAKACVDVPEMNGFWREGAFHPSEAVHVGLGIALRQGGLVAPAIHDAQGQSLDELMKKILDLVARARSGRLRSSEVSDPTVTVTNLGDQGVETVFGVIYPPQVALLGFGKISQRPWAVGQMVGAAPLVTLTLAADHRASDGHRGAQFLNLIARSLQEPERFMEA
jgi:pyruvate dehydrogenase E2 component (dihydrolipoamide acetyltransferase)